MKDKILLLLGMEWLHFGSEYLMKNCSLVVTISGTTGLFFNSSVLIIRI